MTIGTHLKRKGLTILTTAAAAVLAAPAALADPPQGHRPAAQPDLIERYVSARTAKPDLVERWVDGRAGHPDLVERYVAIRRPAGFPDGRPDGYQARRSSSSTSSSVTRIEDGFSWGDAGIGALAGFVLTLVAGGSLLAVRGRRAMVHP